MSLPGFTPNEGNAGEETADHPIGDDANSPPAPNPDQVPTDHGTPDDRSSFVSIGGGLIALGLLACVSSRSRNQPTSRCNRRLG